MESKVVDENEEGPVVPMRVDRFGFVKQEHGPTEGLARSQSAFEYQRYFSNILLFSSSTFTQICHPED